MIPLTKCPGCQGLLEKIYQNESWYQDICQNRCPVLYQQFHQHDFDDNEIGYFKFNTKDFNVYVYIDRFGYKDQIFLYHKVFPREENVQYYFQIIPRFEIEWDKLDKYNDRWNLWKTFS